VGRALKQNLDGRKNRPIVIDDENARHEVSPTNFACSSQSYITSVIGAKTGTDATTVIG
jgi:hypothetical protein